MTPSTTKKSGSTKSAAARKAPARKTAAKPEATPDGVATAKDNDRLEHTHGGTTTRDDATDAGVPMLPGSPDEPVGPEDALGEGPKRGDYSGRIPGEPHESVPVPDADTSEGEPASRLERQKPRTADVGDAPGQKGGVDTA